MTVEPPSPAPKVELGPNGPVSGFGAVPGVESGFSGGAPNAELSPGFGAGLVGMKGSALLAGTAGVVPGVAESPVPEPGFVASAGVVLSPVVPGADGKALPDLPPLPDFPVPDVPDVPLEEVPVPEGVAPEGVAPDGVAPDGVAPNADEPAPAAAPVPAPPPLAPAAPPLWANAKLPKHTPARQSVIHCRLEIMARRSGRVGMDGRARAGTKRIALADARAPRNCLISGMGGERVKGIEPS